MEEKRKEEERVGGRRDRDKSNGGESGRGVTAHGEYIPKINQVCAVHAEIQSAGANLGDVLQWISQ